MHSQTENKKAGTGCTVGKISGISFTGCARSINPVSTSADGDTIYSLSVGKHDADIDLAGTLAADVLSEAIIRAV